MAVVVPTKDRVCEVVAIPVSLSSLTAKLADTRHEERLNRSAEACTVVGILDPLDRPSRESELREHLARRVATFSVGYVVVAKGRTVRESSMSTCRSEGVNS